MSSRTEEAVGTLVLGVMFVIALLFILVCSGLLWVGGWFTDAAAVAKGEFGPKAALKKYEAFKDISARLDAKKADIAVAEGRMANLEKQYAGVPRKNWPRTDLEQSNLWAQEVAGMKSGFNLLAADYNSRMAKANYAFAEVGDLPKGAETPLPRTYKPYESK